MRCTLGICKNEGQRFRVTAVSLASPARFSSEQRKIEGVLLNF